MTPPQGGHYRAMRDSTSIVILRVAVFCPGLPVMAVFAERLPVGLVPEQLLISTVRNDVVDDRRLDVPSFLGALGAERVRPQEPLAFPLPGFSISAA